MRLGQCAVRAGGALGGITVNGGGEDGRPAGRRVRTHAPRVRQDGPAEDGGVVDNLLPADEAGGAGRPGREGVGLEAVFEGEGDGNSDVCCLAGGRAVA